MMRSSNPFLSQRALRHFAPAPGYDVMTVEGTANKTGILFGLALITAALTWVLFWKGSIALLLPLLIVGVVGSLVFVIATWWKPQYARITAPGYALFEGLILGTISTIMEYFLPGIVMQAVALTFAIFVLMLFAYRTRLLRATPAFVKGIVAATGAIMIVYLITGLLWLLGMPTFFIHGSGPWAIGFSLLVIVIAALNLILDFAMIETMANQGVAKSYEWLGAFALMVTLVWLYVEILRLLAKTRGR